MSADVTSIEAFVAKLQRLRGSSPAADSVVREARGHLEDKVSALVESGMTPAEAEREAVAAFGDAGEFACAALASGSLDAVPPRFLRWFMLGGTALTGLAASALFLAFAVTALSGGSENSPVALSVIGGGAAAIILHSVAFGCLLLRQQRYWLLRSGVFLGGIGLLAVSGAAVLGSDLDDSPGGMLGGLLLAAQGGAAVLTIAFPQLIRQRRLPA